VRIRRFGELKELRLKRAVELSLAYSKRPILVWRRDELVYVGGEEQRVKLRWIGGELMAEDV